MTSDVDSGRPVSRRKDDAVGSVVVYNIKDNDFEFALCTVLCSFDIRHFAKFCKL